MPKVPLKFYKSYTNGKASYSVLPSAGVGAGLTEVKDLSEIQTEIGRYAGKTGSWSQNYVSTLKSGLERVQSGESPYALDKKGVLTTQKALASQAEEKRAFEAGETKNIGTADKPMYVPTGSPGALLNKDPEAYKKKYGSVSGSEATTETQPTGFGESSYKGVSIVDYLKSVGQSSSYSDRAKLAEQYGISDYMGSASQNTKLLGMLRSGGMGIGGTGEKKTGGLTSPITNVNNTGGVGTTAEDLGITMGNDLGVTSDQAREQIREDMMEGVDKPEGMDYVSEWDAMRKERGVEALEGELATTKSDIRELEDQTREELRDEEGKLMPMSLISAHQQEIIKDRQEQIDAIIRKQRSITDQLNIANSAIDTKLNLLQMNYGEAKDSYNRDLNLNLKILDVMKSDESDELKAAEANWNVMATSIQSALQSGNIASYYDIPEEFKVKLKDLELRQGLPNGFTETMLANIRPEKSLKTTITSKNKDKISYVYTDGTVEVYDTGIGQEKGQYGLTKEQEEEFYSVIKNSIKDLQRGEDWGNVWDRVKMQFGSVPDNIIDNMLGVSWREKGAYEKFKAKGKIGGGIINPFE